MNAHDAVRLTEAAGVIWLTRRQAAAHANVSVRTIGRWLEQGLEASGGGRGKKLLIHRDTLDEFIRTR